MKPVAFYNLRGREAMQAECVVLGRPVENFFLVFFWDDLMFGGYGVGFYGGEVGDDVDSFVE